MREIKFIGITNGTKSEPFQIGSALSMVAYDEIIQYTGLKDKNGKEIYEGDIVELDSFNPKEYVVEFIEGAFCFTHADIKDYPIDINMVYGSTGPNVEIIENIHESKN